MLVAPEIVTIMEPSEYKKTKYIMVASIIGAVLNVILNFALIPVFGYLAAGYTTLFCYLLFALFHGVFMLKIAQEQKNNREHI